MQAVQTDLALELARLELALAGGDYTVCHDLLVARASVEAEMLMSRIKAGDSSSIMISKLIVAQETVAQETVRSLKADRETILLSVASVSTALPSSSPALPDILSLLPDISAPRGISALRNPARVELPRHDYADDDDDDNDDDDYAEGDSGDDGAWWQLPERAKSRGPRSADGRRPRRLSATVGEADGRRGKRLSGATDLSPGGRHRVRSLNPERSAVLGGSARRSAVLGGSARLPLDLSADRLHSTDLSAGLGVLAGGSTDAPSDSANAIDCPPDSICCSSCGPMMAKIIGVRARACSRRRYGDL